MEQYIDGETYPRTMSVDVAKQIVTVKHVSKIKDGKFYIKTILDLSGEEEVDLLKHAAMNYLIQTIRPRYLKGRKSVDINEELVHSPSDYPAQRGGGVDKREGAIRVLEGLGLDRKIAEDVVDGKVDSKAVKNALENVASKKK